MTCVAMQAQMYEGTVETSQDTGDLDALDLAGGDRGYTREQVDEVRMVLRLGPILLLSVAYWTIYTQMTTVFILQVRLAWFRNAWPDCLFRAVDGGSI